MAQHSFKEIRQRLEEIARDVKVEDIALDDALALYDEAVGYASEAASLLEDIDAAEVERHIQENPDDFPASAAPASAE